MLDKIEVTKYKESIFLILTQSLFPVDNEVAFVSYAGFTVSYCYAEFMMSTYYFGNFFAKQINLLEMR